MAKGFGRATGSRAFSDDEMHWIAQWERFFDYQNGALPRPDHGFPRTIVMRGAKRLDPGQVAGWPWLLSHFERINRSLRKSREPEVVFDTFPCSQTDCERIAKWRAAQPRG